MKFIDIIFYRIAEYYKRKEGGAYKISSLFILTLLFSLNMFSILFLLEYLQNITIFKTKYYILYYVIFPVFSLLLLRYFRFKNYNDIAKFNADLNRNQKNKIDLVIIIYIIISFILCFSIAIYIGEQRN
ncbi:hypothetical protein CW752_07325 [Chryseobacterium sp. PMSZPI]|nr:hypothetical protein CW752_07325 [Chryseobacterium sp. PMSZPI]